MAATDAQHTGDRVLLLQGVAQDASHLLEKLSLSDVRPSTSKGIALAPLALPQLRKLENADLIELGVSRLASKKLLDVYDKAMNDIAQQICAVYGDVVGNLTNPDDKLLSKLRTAYSQRYLSRCEEGKQALLSSIERARARAAAQQEAAELQEERDEESVGIWTDRAHMILEAAWERGHNVTPGEKKLLAEACNLRVRQVTVWFANQRQRRLKDPSKPKEAVVKRTTPRRKRPARRIVEVESESEAEWNDASSDSTLSELSSVHTPPLESSPVPEPAVVSPEEEVYAHTPSEQYYDQTPSDDFYEEPAWPNNKVWFAEPAGFLPPLEPAFDYLEGMQGFNEQYWDGILAEARAGDVGGRMGNELGGMLDLDWGVANEEATDDSY